MIKFEHTEVVGWEAAIRGMRNPMNSWEKSDSFWEYRPCGECNKKSSCIDDFYIGPNDLALMKKLRNSGTDHRKFMRMIEVYVDITAPLYWWKEFDTYKVGTVANSCSTMHKIADKEFTMEDFSFDRLIKCEDDESDSYRSGDSEGSSIVITGSYDSDDYFCAYPADIAKLLIEALNRCREEYLQTKDKRYWWQMIQLLPSSYNQRRTVMLSYEVLANIYKSRKDHKLDEWAAHPYLVIEKEGDPSYNKVTKDKEYFGFCDWIETLPHSELIMGECAK